MRTLLALAACVDPNREPLNEGDLSWEPCPLRFDGKGPPSQCVTTEMPLRWSDPSGEQIDLFAQRWLAGKDSSRAIWMLPGGPGQSGAVYESYVKDLARELPDTDIYLFEHRGVGRSTRLSCPEEESPSSEDGIDVSLSEWPSCLASVGSEWGDDLSAFSSVEAAHDHYLFTLHGVEDAIWKPAQQRPRSPAARMRSARCHAPTSDDTPVVRTIMVSPRARKASRRGRIEFIAGGSGLRGRPAQVPAVLLQHRQPARRQIAHAGDGR